MRRIYEHVIVPMPIITRRCICFLCKAVSALFLDSACAEYFKVGLYQNWVVIDAIL